MVSLGDFSMLIIIFTEGIVKKIIRVVLSVLEEETRQGRHQRHPPHLPPPRQALAWVLAGDGTDDGLVTVVSHKMEGHWFIST